MRSSIPSLLLLFIVNLVIGTSAHASDYEKPKRNYDLSSGYNSADENWQDFSEYVIERTEKDRVDGLSYLVGGGVAGLVGIVGYQNAKDVVSRTIYGLSQTAGLIAIGYGAGMYWTGNEYTAFFTAVNESNLSGSQKVSLLRRYLEKERETRRTLKWIKVGTMLISSAVNFYVASRESDRELRNAFQVFGAVNLAIAFQIAY